MRDWAVELRGLSYACPPVTPGAPPVLANDQVDLNVATGSIHGIIGENGAGKSTAMKLLYGIYAPSAGEIRVHGQALRMRSPRDAIAAGIGMVHQHFMLSGRHSALDNIWVGAGGSRLTDAWRPVPRARLRERLQALSQTYGLAVDWDAAVETLPVGIQQRIEILKLLYQDANILVLDEPTAVLTPQETEALFANLRKLRDAGKTILIITHKLNEVMQLTDRVTVLRRGRVVGARETAQTNPAELAELMVGRRVLLRVDVPPRPSLPGPANGPALRVRAPAGALRSELGEIDFAVERGEIVGIAGVEGNGQSALIDAVLAPGAAESARIEIGGADVRRWSRRRVRAHGVALVPEDRQHQGLLLDSDLADNFVLGHQREPRFSRRGWLRFKALRAAAGAGIEAYDVRPRDLAVKARGLSGGNQQKLIFARELGAARLDGRVAGETPDSPDQDVHDGHDGHYDRATPKLLIAAQPTRGVDVGAIEFIHRQIIDARQRGSGVLLISSELEEIQALADRILVMYRGRVVAEFARGEADETRLGLAMGGGAPR